MPSNVDKLRLPPGYDRRVKLTAEQKQEIREIYATGRCGARPLAREYGVSRDLIRLIVDPSKAEKQRLAFKERRKDGRYYVREKHTKAINSLRKYKEELLEKGILCGN